MKFTKTSLLIALFFSVALPGPISGAEDAEAGAGSEGGLFGARSSEGVSAQAPMSFAGGYGFLPRTYTPGEGRFALPRVVTVISVAEGYDDNTLTNPSPFKTDSWFTNAAVNIKTQLAKPRDLLTFDFGGGMTAYYERPGNDVDWAANVDLAWAHKISSRAQLNAQLSAVYQAQPDISLVNVPTNRIGSNYFSQFGKLDFSYQWSARFRTLTSYALNSLIYEDSAFKASNYLTHTFGNEFHYLISPRTSLVAEYRYAFTDYTSNSSANSDSHFILGGFDTALTTRFNGRLRAGIEMRDYKTTGSSTSPFVETGLVYALSPKSSVEWTNRYGFEESGSANVRQETYRTGLQFAASLNSRLSFTLGTFFAHSTQDLLGIGGGSASQDSFNINVGFRYIVTRGFSIFTNYDFTKVNGGGSGTFGSGYGRNRFTIGAQLTF
jgi:hypothetical protein